MMHTIARNNSVRRLLSLWLAFSFVVSMTNVGYAAPAVVAEGETVPVEVVVPVEEPTAPIEEVVEPEVVPAKDETQSEPEVVPAAVEPDPIATPSPSEEAQPVTGAPAPASVGDKLDAPEPEARVVPAAVTSSALVEPVEVPGNPALGAGGLRIDEDDLPGTFTHTLTGIDPNIDIEITVTLVETPDGVEFSFESDYPVIKVVAKGGNVGANVYEYSPGVLSDSGLHTPMNPSGKWADISHLDFYFMVPTPEFTKTFELTYVGAPEGTTFFAVYQLSEGPEVQVELVPGEDGLYSGSVELPSGSVIEDVTWIAVHEGVTYELGAQLGIDEELTEDLVNSFTYTASVGGHKFGDENANGMWSEGELGLAGWTINLYLDDELVAQTVTGEGGVYGFTGLLPGTYSLSEQMQDGWFMTVGPEGTVDVSNGTALTDLDFGNAEESVPFGQFLFDKDADREVAQPGDIITYTLTYTLTEDSDPWTDPIPVIDDYDEDYLTPLDVGTGVIANGKITWIDNADMAPGEVRVIVYTMMVAAEMPVGETEIMNTALLNVQDGYEDDEVVVVVVDPVLPFTEFEFEKSADVSTAEPGDLVTYTLSYSLTDGSATWTDPIPVIDDYDERYMTPVDVDGGVVSDGKITWTDNDDLEPGVTRTIVYTMRIDAEMPVGTTDVDNVALLNVQGGYEDDWTVSVTVDSEPAEPFLPFTGGEAVLITMLAAIAGFIGMALRTAGRRGVS